MFLLNTNCKRDIVTPTLMLTQQFLSFLVNWGGGVIGLQCCNYYHLPSDSSSKFQSSVTIFHHKVLRREGRVLDNG